MINTKVVGMLVAAFVAGSFIASPELRAYAANTVFSTDIVDGQVKTADLAGNAVTAAKIKDGEVKAAEIAADAVGGSELQGVTKLLFGQCAADSGEGTQPINPNLQALAVVCTISGVDADDSVIAVRNGGNFCFEVRAAFAFSNGVQVQLINACSTAQQLGTGAEFGIIVFDR